MGKLIGEDYAAPLHSCKYRWLHARDLDPRENATVGLLKQPIEADFQPN
jgi:hypothetical protein